MKMKYYNLKTLLLLAAAAFILGGCTKDSLSSCPTKYNVELAFQYSYRGIEAESFAQEVENTEVFVFDAATGAYVTSHFCSKADLASFQGARLYLEPGDYRIVCWGNMLENTRIIKEPEFAQGLTLHTKRAAQSAAEDDPMFYAPRIADLSNPDESKITIIVPEQGAVRRTIDFTAAHKILEIFAKNFSTIYGSTPRIEVTNLASAYDFSMKTLWDSPMLFSQDASPEAYEQNVASAKFNTALFDRHCENININIIDPATGQTVHTLNLSRFIAENNITLTDGDKDYIPVRIEFTMRSEEDETSDIGVIVTTTEWSGTNVIPGVN